MLRPVEKCLRKNDSYEPDSQYTVSAQSHLDCERRELLKHHLAGSDETDLSSNDFEAWLLFAEQTKQAAFFAALGIFRRQVFVAHVQATSQVCNASR